MTNLNKRVIALKVVGGFMLLLFLAGPSAALMIGLSTEELTRNAEIVVSGRVESVESFWSGGGKTIISRATVMIVNPIKGQPPKDRVVVEYEGGEIGDVGLKVSDMQPMEKGSNVILFLRSVASKAPLSGQGVTDKVFRLVGKAQGKYSIDENGIARKSGFSVVNGEGMIDNNIPSQELVDKIRAIK